MLENLYTQQGSKVFLQTAEKAYNYSWIQQRIRKAAGFFESNNIRTGDKIMIAVSDDVEMSSIFISALACGITVVIADPEMKTPRAKAIVNRSMPKMIIADKQSLDSWKLETTLRVIPFVKETAKSGLLSKFLQKSKTEASQDSFLALFEKAEPVEQFPAKPAADVLAYILFTSGTTADSKGVAITHGNLTAHLNTLKKVYDLNSDSTIFNQLLLCHADGCIQGPVLAAFAGCTLHRPFRFSIEKITDLLDYIYANNISHTLMVPAMLNMLVQFGEGAEDSFSHPQFKALISVSAHLDGSLWNSFESMFKVRISNVYGLTETVAGSLFSGPLNETYRRHTVGKPVDCQIRIIDDNGVDVASGETGELLLRGEHIMKEYHDDHETTRKSFIDGWFCTGDLASVDGDGYITIRGRKKNLIISGGINIQPEEVTECLLQHNEVSEACAIGLPDIVFGEKLVAAVVLKQGGGATTVQLIEHCRANLDDKKVPHKIYLLPDLPKGVSGKIQLQVLKEQLEKTSSVRTENSGEYADQVINIAAEVFQVPAASLSVRDTSYTVAGWDSLAHLIFITSLEEKLDVKFSTAEVMTMNSISKAVDLVAQKSCIAATN